MKRPLLYILFSSFLIIITGYILFNYEDNCLHIGGFHPVCNEFLEIYYFVNIGLLFLGVGILAASFNQKSY